MEFDITRNQQSGKRLVSLAIQFSAVKGMGNAIKWSRHTVPNTVAGMRGHTNYMMQYKGYEVILTDEGYSTPAWTIIFRKLTTVHVQRYFTEFMPLQYAKLKAVELMDERVLKDQTDTL